MGSRLTRSDAGDDTDDKDNGEAGVCPLNREEREDKSSLSLEHSFCLLNTYGVNKISD